MSRTVTDENGRVLPCPFGIPVTADGVVAGLGMPLFRPNAAINPDGVLRSTCAEMESNNNVGLCYSTEAGAKAECIRRKAAVTP